MADMISILSSTKKLLGIEDEATQFDTDIKIGINSALMILNQIGFDSFIVSDKEDTWGDFLGEVDDCEAVKSYVYLKTRLMFDPPSNSSLIEAFERQVKELESRLQIQKEGVTPVA